MKLNILAKTCLCSVGDWIITWVVSLPRMLALHHQDDMHHVKVTKQTKPTHLPILKRDKKNNSQQKHTHLKFIKDCKNLTSNFHSTTGRHFEHRYSPILLTYRAIVSREGVKIQHAFHIQTGLVSPKRRPSFKFAEDLFCCTCTGSMKQKDFVDLCP